MTGKWNSAEINDEISTLNRKIGNLEEKERDKELAVRRRWKNEMRMEQLAKKQKWEDGRQDMEEEKAEDRKKAERVRKGEMLLIVNLAQTGSKSEP
jgi:vacuolar-type H+-ATPase subunit I/STV1